MPDFVLRVWAHLVGLSTLKKSLLAFACTVMVVELLFRRFAPDSKAYVAWTKFFQGIGKVWTAVILSIVYVFSIGIVGLVLKLVRRDPLDRTLAPAPTFWRDHEPNPLGPEVAARHQF